jgi:hypothetical protein
MNAMSPVDALRHTNAVADALAETTRALVVLAREQSPPVSWKQLGVLTGLNPRTLARWFA